jgi:GrpB-like predicted nucleotidyltransferase (UPF0157 family)
VSHAGYQERIAIVDPDPGWAGAFDAEAASVRAALGALLVRLDHIGSTAVPGLPAKPIIDLQASVDPLDPDDLGRRLAPLGYARVRWPADATYPFYAKPPDGPRTHHLHACEAGGDEERRHLAVRDFLRARADEAAAYGAFKRDLAARCGGLRTAYVEGKDAYVKALEARALAWAAGRAS